MKKKKNYRPSAKKVVDQVDRSRAFAYLLYFLTMGYYNHTVGCIYISGNWTARKRNYINKRLYSYCVCVIIFQISKKQKQKNRIWRVSILIR